jgi:hypothetical protein
VLAEGVSKEISQSARRITQPRLFPRSKRPEQQNNKDGDHGQGDGNRHNVAQPSLSMLRPFQQLGQLGDVEPRA